jgi:hypothetical protein
VCKLATSGIPPPSYVLLERTRVLLPNACNYTVPVGRTGSACLQALSSTVIRCSSCHWIVFATRLLVEQLLLLTGTDTMEGPNKRARTGPGGAPVLKSHLLRQVAELRDAIERLHAQVSCLALRLPH